MRDPERGDGSQVTCNTRTCECPFAAETHKQTRRLTNDPFMEDRVSPPGVSTSDTALPSLEEGVPPGATAVIVDL